MRRLRVAYLPGSLALGGAERQMLALAERLPRDRFEAEIVVLSGVGHYDERARSAGLRLRSAGEGPAPRSSLPARIWHRTSKTARYARVVRDAKYDIVDAWLYPADVLATLMRPITGTPVVITGVRNVDPQEYFGPLEGGVSTVVRWMADAVVANSEAAAMHAMKMSGIGRSKVRVIRNGVVVGELASDEERMARRHELGVPDPDQVVIGCVANFRPVKQHALLIDAFAPLVMEARRATLVLVGDGLLRPAIERQIHDLGIGGSVRLHGSVADPERLYPGFDLVVQASEREGLPNALLEAGAAGRALVATAAGGTAEIVIDGQTGLLCAVGDRDALTTALRRLTTDAELRGLLGRGARTHVASTFGMDRFVGEFADLYETLAAQKGLLGS
jgi:glycosyltransferase involved in cell wall biosynthesis